MKLNDIRTQSNYIELDFDSRYTVQQIADVSILVTDFTTMTTAYGKKDIALFTYSKGKKTISGWFYLTETLSHLKDAQTPFNVTITKKKSATGKEYWTSNLKKTYNNVKITDLVDEIITIKNIVPIDTRYGVAYRVTANHNDQEVSFLSNWEYLYNDLLRYLEETAYCETLTGLLEEDPLTVKVIESKSKKNPDRVYITYTDV